MPTMPLNPPLHFGTDGWRGIIAEQFTFERLGLVVPIAAQVLAETFDRSLSKSLSKSDGSQTPAKIVVGYDRRFLSAEFALFTAETLAKVGFDVLLAAEFAPTPAFSWAAFSQLAIGALVITASHNPAIYNGLKIKGAFGGSVSADFTQKVEERVNAGVRLEENGKGKIERFDPWQSYTAELRSKVDLAKIQAKIRSGELKLFTDVMHGTAATGLGRILELTADQIQESRADRDPLFSGVSPEPIAANLNGIIQNMQADSAQLAVGFAFDGDSDRLAAIDTQGNFLSSQMLIPILIQHFQGRGVTGEVIKTVSGSDLIPKVAALYDLPVHETAVGFKYIADRMLANNASGNNALLGGEESGGIGYGNHIPERDALLSALYVLEAIAHSGKDLSVLYDRLQQQTGFFSSYDRVDKYLPNQAAQVRLMEYLRTNPFTEIDGIKVINVQAIDGYKFRLEDDSWLMVRFSGTEPVLRLYCEAEKTETVKRILAWAVNWIDALN